VAEEMTPEAQSFEDLPPEIQAAVKRRDAVTQPLMDGVKSIDLTWEIAGGNMAELNTALLVWEGKGWERIHQDAVATHRYHRLLLRLFHNFLSSSVSTMWHAEQLVSKLKGVAPPLEAQFRQRKNRIQASEPFRLLLCLRDYAIHTGHHLTELVLRGSEAQSGETTLVGSVCFDLKVVRGFLEAERLRARSGEKSRRIQATLDELRGRPDSIDMRELLETYYSDVGTLLRWLRSELLEATQAAHKRPLAQW
jgi:hypothetical protein